MIVKNGRFDLSTVNYSPVANDCCCRGVRPRFEYVDGKATKNVLGYLYSCAGANSDNFDVYIPGRQLLAQEDFDAARGVGISVLFSGLEVTVKPRKRGETWRDEFSVTATGLTRCDHIDADDGEDDIIDA